VSGAFTALWAGFQAELVHLRRSRLLVALTVVEALTFLVLVSFFGLTVTNVPTAVVDADGGPAAQQWISDMTKARNSYGVRLTSQEQARNALRRGEVAAVVTIPMGFSDDIANHRMTRMPVVVDNINADVTEIVDAGFPSVAIPFALRHDLPGIRVQPAETNLIADETAFVPYILVVALALDAFIVSGILAASAVAREFEARTISTLALAPVSVMIPLAGRLLATSAASAVAMALTVAVIVAGYRVIPAHPLELVVALLACVVIFSFVGAAIGVLLKRTLPVAALLFGLALPLFVNSGFDEPLRFEGEVTWLIGHTSPVYFAAGVLQHAVHDLNTTPEPVGLDFVILVAWAAIAGLVAWAVMRRGVRA
jgi:ABC-2 type transport system permease protein